MSVETHLKSAAKELRVAFRLIQSELAGVSDAGFGM